MFLERPGLSEPRKVEDIQEVYTSTLQAYIDVNRPKHRTVFARLLMKLTDLRTLGCEQADVLFSLKLNGGQCRLPIGMVQSANEDAEAAASSSRKSSNQQSQIQGEQSINHRVPNVRIKVEPLNGNAHPNQYQQQVNGEEMAGAAGFECHSTLYLQAHDDVNNNNHNRYQQDESMQQAVSSSTFPDNGPKWT